jgi:hypothetical protein
VVRVAAATIVWTAETLDLPQLLRAPEVERGREYESSTTTPRGSGLRRGRVVRAAGQQPPARALAQVINFPAACSIAWAPTVASAGVVLAAAVAADSLPGT